MRGGGVGRVGVGIEFQVFGDCCGLVSGSGSCGEVPCRGDSSLEVSDSLCQQHHSSGGGGGDGIDGGSSGGGPLRFSRW